jgi:hypothetical protein
VGDDGPGQLTVRPFHRRFGKYTASFEPAEASLIADLVDQVRQLLADRRAQAPVDPLAQLTGMTMGPDSKPADPAVARLLPDFHAQDAQLSSGLRVLHEPDLIADGAAAAWMAALNDVRLALGVRLEISEDDTPPPGVDVADSPQAAMYATYRWLSAVQDSLVSAMLDA